MRATPSRRWSRPSWTATSGTAWRTRIRRPGQCPGQGPAGRVARVSHLLAAQYEDHAPRSRRVDGQVGVKVAVAGHGDEPSGEPDGGGQLGRAPEPVRHYVGDRPHRAAPLVISDA